jgi:predicted DsbA family dithiol-disulfide isomerase
MGDTEREERKPPIVADYFSDILCVWAHAGQVRIDELKRNFGTQVALRYRFLALFGDVHGRIRRDWGGDPSAYADRVQALAAGWDHVRIHPQVWRRNVPASSFGIHRFLKAVDLCTRGEGRQGAGLPDQASATLESVTRRLRHAFFEQALDISRPDLQDSVAQESGLDPREVRARAEGGEADAALISDLELKEAQHIPGSPTLVLNDGRQQLYGSVGYRVIEANVRELLRDPQFGEATWCR